MSAFASSPIASIKYFHRQAIRQTVDWLDHYDVPYWDLCFMKEKAAVGADLYIDDSPTNVQALRAQGLLLTAKDRARYQCSAALT